MGSPHAASIGHLTMAVDMNDGWVNALKQALQLRAARDDVEPVNTDHEASMSPAICPWTASPPARRHAYRLTRWMPVPSVNTTCPPTIHMRPWVRFHASCAGA